MALGTRFEAARMVFWDRVHPCDLSNVRVGQGVLNPLVAGAITWARIDDCLHGGLRTGRPSVTDGGNWFGLGYSGWPA